MAEGPHRHIILNDLVDGAKAERSALVEGWAQAQAIVRSELATSGTVPAVFMADGAKGYRRGGTVVRGPALPPACWPCLVLCLMHHCVYNRCRCTCAAPGSALAHDR